MGLGAAVLVDRLEVGAAGEVAVARVVAAGAVVRPGATVAAAVVVGARVAVPVLVVIAPDVVDEGEARRAATSSGRSVAGAAGTEGAVTAEVRLE